MDDLKGQKRIIKINLKVEKRFKKNLLTLSPN